MNALTVKGENRIICVSNNIALLENISLSIETEINERHFAEDPKTVNTHNLIRFGVTDLEFDQYILEIIPVRVI